MPRAEVGSARHLANKMKSKGLQRLRWYCQVCEKQCRDANGFKQHTMSEAHVRRMLVVGENSGKVISDYSGLFKRNFIHLLKTSHGEKMVNLNHFYQEVIRDKEHVHLNSTRWASLTEFGKHLGREGICRVEEGDKGFEIAWIDDSPEALRKKDAIRKKERQDKGDEEREQRLIAEQVERAQREAEEKGVGEIEEDLRFLRRDDGEKLSLNFNKDAAPAVQLSSPPDLTESKINPGPAKPTEDPTTGSMETPLSNVIKEKPTATIGMSLGSIKPKNVFATTSKKNALSGGKPPPKVIQPKTMSEAERIMKEELHRKRMREANGFHGPPGKKSKG